jgi:hypothetical protein
MMCASSLFLQSGRERDQPMQHGCERCSRQPPRSIQPHTTENVSNHGISAIRGSLHVLVAQHSQGRTPPRGTIQNKTSEAERLP